MLAVGPLGPQYCWLFAWYELGRQAHLGVDTLPTQRVPQKILKKSISLYYIVGCCAMIYCIPEEIITTVIENKLANTTAHMITHTTIAQAYWMCHIIYLVANWFFIGCRVSYRVIKGNSDLYVCLKGLNHLYLYCPILLKNIFLVISWHGLDNWEKIHEYPSNNIQKKLLKLSGYSSQLQKTHIVLFWAMNWLKPMIRIRLNLFKVCHFSLWIGYTDF